MGIEISGDNEEDAFRSFAQEIKELKEKRKVSSNKKIRKEQLKLIRKIDNIEKENEDFQKYLYRIVIDNDEYKKKKFKLRDINNINRLKKKNKLKKE